MHPMQEVSYMSLITLMLPFLSLRIQSNCRKEVLLQKEKKKKKTNPCPRGLSQSTSWMTLPGTQSSGISVYKDNIPNENKIWITERKKRPNPPPPPYTHKLLGCTQASSDFAHPGRKSFFHPGVEIPNIRTAWSNTRCLVALWEGAGPHQLLQLWLETAFPWMNGLEYVQWVLPKISENCWDLKQYQRMQKSNSWPKRVSVKESGPSQGLRDPGDGGALHKALRRKCPLARPSSFPCSLDWVESGWGNNIWIWNSHEGGKNAVTGNW